MKIFICIICIALSMYSGFMFRTAYDMMIKEGYHLSIRHILKYGPKYIFTNIPMHIYFTFYIAIFCILFAITILCLSI